MNILKLIFWHYTEILTRILWKLLFQEEKNMNFSWFIVKGKYYYSGKVLPGSQHNALYIFSPAFSTIVIYDPPNMGCQTSKTSFNFYSSNRIRMVLISERRDTRFFSLFAKFIHFINLLSIIYNHLFSHI